MILNKKLRRLAQVIESRKGHCDTMISFLLQNKMDNAETKEEADRYERQAYDYGVAYDTYNAVLKLIEEIDKGGLK